MAQNFLYNRVLIKLSGEALKGSQDHGYQAAAIREVVSRIKRVMDDGVEIALVVGAGNLWRGINGSADGMDRVHADQMGMLATIMNAMALREFFQEAGAAVSIQCAFDIPGVVHKFNRDEALRALEAGQVVIFAGGTGNPYFTTDTASVLRALETNCDAVLKATKVDGVYSADPMRDPNAVRYEKLSFDEALEKQLRVMDSAAFSLCRDNDLPIIVFNFSDPESLGRVLGGDTAAGTIVS